MKSHKLSTKKNTSIVKGKKKEPFTIVAIGASAGGLESVTNLFKNLPPNTGMAYIYVQHLSPDHKSLLTPLLSKTTKMKVQDIENMEKMEPDNVYVIPYDRNIEVTNGHIKLIPRPKNKPTNLSIDVLFSSLALTHKSNVIGVVLSGNGSDGSRGLKEIKLAGGITFAQDDSAKNSSMPNSAIAEGIVDFVLSPEDIAKEIVRLSKHPFVKSIPLKEIPEDEIENSNPDLKIILQLLHKKKNVDFSHYKLNTVKRRTLRRMLINRVNTIKQYANLVQEKNEEIDLLYKDLLINVTDFFRDPEAFSLLKKSVLSKLIKSKVSGQTLRVWVAACATGEEVYSIAMMLYELQDNKAKAIPFQIFASDLSLEAIKEARAGEYFSHQLSNVSPKRLQRFFTKSKDKYRISQALRDVCIFAQHNILIDPPFSRMDLISCRNFLIYLEGPAQKRAISTFHYALNEGGYLMLGKSETIGTSTNLFTSLSKTYKIYSRKNTSGTHSIPDLLPRMLTKEVPKIITPSPSVFKKGSSSSGEKLSIAFDTVLLEGFVPASVIINYEMEILQFRGDTSLYLKQAPGKASFNILKMVNTEITFELRNAIHHAIKSKQSVRKTGLEMNRDFTKNTVQIVNLEVAHIKMDSDEEPFLVVVFTGQQIDLSEHSVVGKKNNSITKDRRIKKLEEELASARYDMGTITRDQELANEELQSANEEVVSSNEELQSLNEELETSKEETESTNEELTTTNHELQVRIQEVEELYLYYEGILSTVHEPMLILDKDLRVKSANRSFYKVFRVNEKDTLGVSLFKLGENQWNIPRLRELLEDIVPKKNHFQDYEVEITFPVIGRKTMLLSAHRIIQQRKKEDLIVFTIVDITEVKRLAIELQLKERKMLEVEHASDKKLLLKTEESNNRLLEAKQLAEQKTKIAEEAMHSKQQFLSNMSHEIRTPLNAIIGFTNVMLKTVLSNKQNEFLSAIKTSGETLTVLINDILDLAKVDAGKMTFEKRVFNLEESISSMLQLFEGKIQEKNLKLLKNYDVNIPKVLLGDPVRLHQIILNLVSNAEKFTVTGEIVVQVKLLYEDEGKVTIEFSVSDTGIGIQKDKIEHIFENFQQASSGTSRLYGGTGLGLAIVKQLVESQGGSISVESEMGVGSTFKFIMSFEKTSEVLEEESESTEINSEHKNVSVLVVEDVALNQLLIKTLLADFRFNYDSAPNGKVAIKKLEGQNAYDIILMDLQMPEMDGFETTNYIRNTLNSKIPIIALTADVTTVDLAKCKAFGMDDYLSKPVDDKLLLDKIISLTRKPTPIEFIERQTTEGKPLKYVDLSYLTRDTQSDPNLMIEMISIYLEQTPPLINEMKQSLLVKDWNLLQSVVHKMIPSFSIMGISKDFENIAKRVQEDANNIQLQANGISTLVLELESICTQACKELEEEFYAIKSNQESGISS